MVPCNQCNFVLHLTDPNDYGLYIFNQRAELNKFAKRQGWIQIPTALFTAAGYQSIRYDPIDTERGKGVPNLAHYDVRSRNPQTEDTKERVQDICFKLVSLIDERRACQFSSSFLYFLPCCHHI